MRLNDLELRNLYQRRTARRGMHDGCPAPEELVRAALGDLDAEQRGRLADHLVGCSDCSREVLLLRSLRPAEVAGPGPSVARALPRSRLLALAAGLVLAAGLSWLLWPQAWRFEAPPPVQRGEETPALSPAPAIQVEPRHGAALAEPPERLSWEPEAEASYRVVLYDFELTVLWESPKLTTASVQLSPELRERLRRGRIHFWRVFVESGLERRQSRLYEFTLRP
jgi:hypothetical protein